jgi:putative ABC transport system ATP-binding protein
LPIGKWKTGFIMHASNPLQSSAEQTLTSEDTIIFCRDVWKTYHTQAGDVPALKGINLEIRRGEFVAVYGKSGAGKSTLINVISGIDPPDSGEIIINGTATHLLDEDQRSRWRGRNLGVVFQFFQLLPSLNLIENITIPMDLCRAVPPRERKPRALALLEQMEIAAHGYKPPSRISGGQQQRVAIARALANDPPLLLADEPTGNLDSSTRDAILRIFSQLSASGRTVLVVTHDQEISHRADRVIHLVDGLIRESA